MFRKLSPSPTRVVRICIDGSWHEADEGEPLAAVFHRLGEPIRNHPLTGEPRVPYCMMGVCFECLVTINDGTTAQACLVPASEGLTVFRQTDLKSVHHDQS